MVMEKKTKSGNDNIVYFLAYLLLWLTGIIVYLTSGRSDKKAKFHAIQAIFLGVIGIIISVFFSILYVPLVSSLLNFLIWIYALYVGFQAYNGVEVDIPYITEYAKKAL